MSDTLEVIAVCRHGSELTATLRVPDELQCLRGHFEGRPVLPGAMQLVAMSALAEVLVDDRLRMARVSRVRFNRFVGPGTLLEAVLTRREDKVRFVLCASGAAVSSGTLSFEARA